MPSRRIDTKKAEALARWEAAHGLGPQDPKVTRLKRPTAPAAGDAPRARVPLRHKPTPEERMAETMERMNIKPLPQAENLPPYDVTQPTRYPEPDTHRAMRASYRKAIKAEGITAAALRDWREHVMQLTPEQLAELVRVTPRTIRDWENGKSRIPFAMWWVMYCTLTPAEDLPSRNAARATQYPAADMGGDVRMHIERHYGYALKPHDITAADFQHWRVHFMLLTVKQAAALVRVTPKTILDWESGKSDIPFSMWWVMHTTMQDPKHFLTRPGFHDFRVDYEDGEARLCSTRHPDISYSVYDLYLSRAAVGELASLRSELAQMNARIDGLTAENTRLRQALKGNGVTRELQAMHTRLSALVQQLATADVLSFPDADEHVDVMPLKQATA